MGGGQNAGFFMTVDDAAGGGAAKPPQVVWDFRSERRSREGGSKKFPMTGHDGMGRGGRRFFL